MRRFLLVGLTGSIATGKSTVSAMFAHQGARVIDADLLSREVVMPGQPAYARILEEFDEFQPDLIITDIEMPELDGIQLVEQVRNYLPREACLPILVLTNRNDQDLRAELQPMGIASFNKSSARDRPLERELDRIIGRR